MSTSVIAEPRNELRTLEVCQARVLAQLAITGRTLKLRDLRDAPGLADAGDVELAVALAGLIEADLVEVIFASVRYRDGDQYSRRDVATYRLTGRWGR